MAEKKTKVKTEKTKVEAKKTTKSSSTKKTTKAVKPSVVKKVSTTKEAKVTKKSLAGEIVKPEGKVVQYAVGRRKRAVARVRMYDGNGQIIINEKLIEDYSPSKAVLTETLKPLELSGAREGHTFTIKVVGGGIIGQMEATRHGIARILAKISDDMKNTMKQGGFLTRDPREKERKKVYHVKARKSPQYSKR